MASRYPDLPRAWSLRPLNVERDVVGARARAGVEAPGPVERGGVEAEDVGVEVVAVVEEEVEVERREREEKGSGQSVR